MSTTPTKVYAIPGRISVGDPAIDHEVESKAEAERLVGTGAFALSEKEANAQAWAAQEATPATDANVKKPKPTSTPEQPAAPPAPEEE